MIPAMNVALSGLNAAEKRLSVSANNIANINSTGRTENGERVSDAYSPQKVVQTSFAEGGVKTGIETLDPSTNPVYAPNDAGADENGITQMPNVSLEGEMVSMKIATYDFKANLKTIKSADDMMKNLLNIVS